MPVDEEEMSRLDELKKEIELLEKIVELEEKLASIKTNRVQFVPFYPYPQHTVVPFEVTYTTGPVQWIGPKVYGTAE